MKLSWQGFVTFATDRAIFGYITDNFVEATRCLLSEYMDFCHTMIMPIEIILHHSKMKNLPIRTGKKKWHKLS